MDAVTLAAAKSNAKQQLEDINIPFPQWVSMINLLPGSNFATTWTPINASHSAVSNEGIFTITAADADQYILSDGFPYAQGHKIYVKMAVSADTSLAFVQVAGVGEIYHSGSGKYEVLSGVLSREDWGGTTRLRVGDERGSEWTEIRAKWGVVIDLTAAFGAGNEPTKEAMDAYILNHDSDMWIDGTEDISTHNPATKVYAFIDGMLTFVDPNLVAKQTLSDKTIAFFGDSITERYLDHVKIAERTGAEIVNLGIGDTTLAEHEQVAYDAFSFYRLADAIATGVWTLQDTYADTPRAGRLDALKAVVWVDVDVIVVSYGTNDYSGEAPLGTVADDDGTTFYGAINYSIDTVLTAYPHIQFIFIAPLWRQRLVAEDGLESDGNPNGDGIYLIEYVDALKNRGEKFKFPVYDQYRNSGVNIYNHALYMDDGLHLSSVGATHMGNKIAAFLLGNL